MNVLTPHQKKALNIESSISLTANAGSGKTFVLAQRFIEIIVNTSVPLSQIAAITFTEKAAGELYKRISEEINGLVVSVTDLKLKERIEKVRKQLVSSNISTIHSFCIDLLKIFPVEASIDANFIPIDEQRSSELINLCIENSLAQMLRDAVEHSDVKSLIRLLGSKAKLVAELSEIIKKRKNVINLVEKIYSGSEDEIASAFFQMFKSNSKIVFEKELPEVFNNLRIINEKVLDNNPENVLALELKLFYDKNISAIFNIKEILKLKELRDKILTSDGSVRKKSYLTAEKRDEVQNSVKVVESFFSDLDEIELTDNHKLIERELAKYGLALIKVFQNILKAYERKKLELGVLDFEDILLKTKKLLSNESVRKILSSKYRYLLIDEYQDTNEIQYDIFLPLVDQIKSGNLFIVGDEKQSIYRFRDAELQVFSRTKADILELYGESSLLTLPDSFRMAPAICLFVNFLFKNLFKEPNLFFSEVPASDLVCARSDDFLGHVEFLIAEGEEAEEAELVAQRVIRLKSENSKRIKKWNDIAILVRKRASFTELQKSFIKNHIPFKLVGGTGFYQKQSISDIYNYFSFLLNDKDDAALIGVLRSPFFLVSDADILELSIVEGESYWEKLKSASFSKKDFWSKIFDVLIVNKKLADRVNIPILLRKILKESDFISIISSRIDGAQEISNLNKLASITNEFFNDEFNTLYDYVSYLRNAISSLGDEAQAGIVAGTDGVNILTIHQSKGLEYRAVFLYKCNDFTITNKVKSRSFTVDKDFGLLTKVPIDENYFGSYQSAPLVGIYNLIESKRELAETKRLLYVGMTRAIDFLFITQTKEDRSAKKNSFSFLISEGLKNNLNMDKIILEGKLDYLKQENGTYKNFTKFLKLEIPVIRFIKAAEKLILSTQPEISNTKFTLSEIIDQSKGEVISATRFSTFSICPFKYNLAYNYKLGDLIQKFSKFRDNSALNVQFEYNRNELNSYLFDDVSNLVEFSKVKGQLIHYILRKNIINENISRFVEERLQISFKGENSSGLKEEIINDLQRFYASDQYVFINSFQNYKNEFEVYLKETDYYLFGIIDKLIIQNDKLIIVDYKTDSIESTEINSRAEKYLHQLRFYAYIISRIFNWKFEIECRIIFIKNPENPFIFNYDELSDKNTKAAINSMILSLRNNNYSVNLDACKDCIFADENSLCIKSKS